MLHAQHVPPLFHHHNAIWQSTPVVQNLTTLRYATLRYVPPILLSTVILSVRTNSNMSAVVYIRVVLIFTFRMFSCLSAACLETTRL